MIEAGSLDGDARTAILEVIGLSVSFGSGQGAVRAVDEVSLCVHEGDIYAIVGESGCGKSTLALNQAKSPSLSATWRGVTGGFRSDYPGRIAGFG